MTRLWMAAILAVVAIVAVRGQQAPGAPLSAGARLEAAMKKEVVDGDLKAAIEQYKALANGADRAVAAKALVRLGECYAKQGNAESAKAWERVVREFADQKDAVAEAMARLGGSPAVQPAGQPAARVVWTGSKVDYEAMPDPDGRLLPFTDWDTGDLALHDLTTGVDRLLTNTGTLKTGGRAFAEGSAISRDGTQVAYGWFDVSVGAYQLRLVGVGERRNPPRTVRHGFDWLNPRDWTPDGTWILAAWYEENTNQIGFVRAQDGSLRILKSDTREFLNVMGLSPDGRHLVYTRATISTDLGSYRGYIMSADATSDVPLLPGAGSVESAAWTPDGSRIVFVSNRSGSQGLWSVRVADGKPAGEPELLKADFNGSQVMGCGRDGSLVYSVFLSLTDIYVAGLDPATGKLTSEPRRVNERAIGNSWGRVAWLPDGKSLSFWNAKPADVLVVQSLANGEVRELWGGKTGRLSRHYTGWFPDGTSVMAVNRAGPTWEFQRVDSRSGDALATWAVPAPPAAWPSLVFSPDLMTMFFWRKDEAVPCEGVRCTYAMVARSLQTGRDHELFRLATTRWFGKAAISPDGREVAFTRREGQTTSVMIAPTGGGAPRVIHQEASDVVFRGIAWTRDGGHVLTFRGLGADGELWSLPVKGGPPEKSPVRVLCFETSGAVSPDGTQIAFVGGTSKSEVWVMTGLFTDAKNGRR